MCFLHEANVVHRDIKSSNILITSDCQAKICDFGLSRSLPSTIMNLSGCNSMELRDHCSSKFDQMRFKEQAKKNFITKYVLGDRDRRKKTKRCMSIHVGSRWYRAPEVSLIERQYDQSSDMWSFGCILFELLRYTLRDDSTFDK